MKRSFVFFLLIAVLGVSAGRQAVSQTLKTSKADYLSQGIQAFHKGSYEEAEEAFARARVQNPSSALAAYYLGMTMKRMQHYPAAIENLKDAVTLQPPVQEAFLEIADAYYATGKNDEALHALAVAEKLGKKPAETAFLKGLILSKKRNFSDAAASFEYAKSLDQKLASTADYHIAVIHLRTGKSAEAKDLLKAVATRDPDSDIGILAKEQFEAITAAEKTEKKRFNAVAGIHVQYDSNVVLLPNGFSLSELDISREDDSSAVLTVQSDYTFVATEPFDLKLQYSLYWNSHAELKEFDVQSHILGGSADYRLGEKTISLIANYNYTLVHDEKYLNVITVSPTIRFVPSENSRFFISLLYQAKDYYGTPFFSEENRNAGNIGAGLAWFAPLGELGGFSVRYDINQEDAEGANWSYLGNRISGGIQYAATEKTRLIGNIDMNNQAYDSVHSTFQKKRKDTIYTAGMQLAYSVLPNLDAQLTFSYTKADSTIDVYSFNKYLAGVGLLATF